METADLRAFDNYFSAHIILGRLKQEGINCFLKDEYTVTIDPVLSNAVGGIKLAVDRNDVPAATRLLQQFDEEFLRTVECPACGGNNITLVNRAGSGNFITAVLTWLFGGYAIAPDKIYQCCDCRYESKTLPESKAGLN